MSRLRPRTGFGHLPHIDKLLEKGPGRTKSRRPRQLFLFSFPILFAVTIQTIVYSVIFLSPPRRDFLNLALACAVVGLVPICSAFALLAIRRLESPIISSFAVSTAFFSFAVTILSAARLPVSYVGLAAVYPITLTAVAYVSIRIYRRISGTIAVLQYPGCETIIAHLGNPTKIIRDPELDKIDFDVLVIDPNHHHSDVWSALLTRCYLGHVDVVPWTRMLEVTSGRVDVDTFEISHITYSPSQFAYVRVKRFLDLALVVVTLPLTLLVGGLVAAFIFARDGGPVLFVQHRLGFGGQVFRLYKFRTMFKGRSGGATLRGDDRVIPGCHLLRRLRLDEMPQLFNVLRGEMSVVGPRPESLDLAKWYQREIPEYIYRLVVTPGITGWAQVNNGYTSNSDEAKVKLSYDLYYVKRISLDLDLLVIFRTFKTLATGLGAR